MSDMAIYVFRHCLRLITVRSTEKAKHLLCNMMEIFINNYKILWL